ncbi:P-loop containing nucleoside triphosphate hydrolase protein [Trichoderma pleuroticola]
MPPLLQDGPGLIQHDDNACSMDDIEDFKKAMGKSYQQSSANKDMIPEDLGGLDYSDDEHKGSNVASVSKDYHIVIALSAAELGIRRGDTTAKGSSVDVIYPSKRPLLPYRIRIANELLMDELDQHCGFHCDHDHVAPFRTLVLVLQATGGRNSIIPRKSANGNSKRTVSDLIVDCFSLDFNGKEFGAKPNVFNIRPYDDHIPVPELPVFPLKFLDQNIRDELFERGHKFVELVEPGHRRYQGLSLKEGDRFDVYEEIDSDVIVDFQLAFQNSEAKISPPLFGGGVITNPTAEDDEETRTDGWTYDDPELLMLRWQKFSHATELLRNQTPSFLSKDSYVLLPYRVYGYVLLSRKWLPLHIDLTKKVPEIKPGENDNFRKLVLPEGHKDIVRALVSAHARQRSLLINSDKANRVNRDIDIVKGKGKGLIILLHGAPGVGKTSTAECVAANAGRPLLPITCGDLGGISAKEVEQNLENFFDLARKWNCVLLLDEADVFLSTRDGGDIRQTSLVSVFLRVLEYYSGILILTTNRVGSFDEAIKSRVHCALYYPPLDQKQSLKIWKMNLATLEERNKEPDSSMSVRFNRKEIEEYARKHWKSTSKGTRWNGRQIKNAFQTAIALADWDHVESTGGNLHPDGPLLKVEHFKKVAQASAHFDNYLIKVRKTDEQRAREHDIRRDDVGFDPDEEPTKRAPGKTKLLKSKSGRTATTSSEPSEDGSEEETEDEDASDFQSDSVEEEEKEITRSPSPPPKKKNSKKKRERE